LFSDQICLKTTEISDDFLFKSKKSPNQNDNTNSDRTLQKRKALENDQDNSAEKRIITSRRNSKQIDFQNTSLKAIESNVKNETITIYDNDSSKQILFLSLKLI